MRRLNKVTAISYSYTYRSKENMEFWEKTDRQLEENNLVNILFYVIFCFTIGL